jgi:hypothetical protein
VLQNYNRCGIWPEREREKDLNARSDGAIESDREERISLMTVRSGEGARLVLSWKPFGDSTIGKSEMC